MYPGVFLRVFASSVLLVLAFPGPEIGASVFLALVPLLSVLSGAGKSRAFLYGQAAGTAWFFVSYNWVSHSLTDFGGIPFLVAEVLIFLMASLHGVYVGLFSIMAAVVVEGERKYRVGETGKRGNGERSNRLAYLPVHPVTPVLVLPAAWVLLEVARSWFPVPFPWLLFGSAAVKIPFAGALLETVGIYGVSGWIVAVNVALWKLTVTGTRRRYACILVVLLVLPLLLSPLQTRGTGEVIRVGVVQGNISQELKWEESLRDEMLETYLSLTDSVVEKGAKLVVWPETAVPSFYQAEPELMHKLRDYTSTRDIHLIFGSPGYEISGREILLYNRVYHLPPDGVEEFYDKIMLVPFGEYVPFARLLPFVDKMVPGEGEFARGDWGEPFGTPAASGALVCYEISVPSLARREVRDGSLILVNVTNDAWFGRSWGPYQHLALSFVRAVENRTPVIRAANTGISAIIDHKGRMIRSIPLDQRGAVVADVETRGGQSLYTRFGDWIVILCAAVVSLYFLVLSIVRRYEYGTDRHL